MLNLNNLLPPEQVHKYFVLEGSKLYRKLTTGSATLLKSRDGKQVVTLFKTEKLLGTSIAWCLIYGNWPEFPIVQLSEDPFDFSQDNLYPARIKRLRYCETVVGNLLKHPLSTRLHINSRLCRKDWEDMARDFYLKDYAYVLRLETVQRELRAQHLAELAQYKPELVPAARPEHERPVRPARPKAIPGREWHWYNDAWMHIPVACHVADDYRVRIKAVLAGAVAFLFNASTSRVDAILPDGSVWQGV
jgi:hypothetical protein